MYSNDLALYDTRMCGNFRPKNLEFFSTFKIKQKCCFLSLQYMSSSSQRNICPISKNSRIILLRPSSQKALIQSLCNKHNRLKECETQDRKMREELRQMRHECRELKHDVERLQYVVSAAEVINAALYLAPVIAFAAFLSALSESDKR